MNAKKPAAKPATKAKPKNHAEAPKRPAKVAAPAPKPAHGKPNARHTPTPVKAVKGGKHEAPAKPAAHPVKAAHPAKPAAKPAAGKSAVPAKGKAKGNGKEASAQGKPGVPVEEDFNDVDTELEVEVDAEVVEAAKEEKAKPLRMKVSRAKERALMREFGLDEATLTEEEVAKRRQELKTLIKMGKTRGFLTHQEINDHLPEKLVDNEIIEAIVSMLNDMGIAVYEQAPDAATLLIAGGTTTTATEEEAEEAAEAALSTVDSEFGRTTDPVRMYMREMGSVELLTREGEIEIAKRIEGGLQAMMYAISASPTTINEILSMAQRIADGDMQISEAVDGFVSDDEADDYVAEEDFDEFDEEDDDDGQGGSKALTKKLEELKAQALVKFATLALHFDKMSKAFQKEGYRSPAYDKAQRAISDDLMTIRFTVKTIETTVRHPALAGRRRAPLRARDPQDRGRQVRHAAGPLHPHLPAQRAEPEVGRARDRRRQDLQHRADAQPAGDPGAAAKADRPAGPCGGAAGGFEADQQDA